VTTQEQSQRAIACGEDIGFGMRCRRERGHYGFHTWDPKRLLGEDPVQLPASADEHGEKP
jgi:hypothetical protein